MSLSRLDINHKQNHFGAQVFLNSRQCVTKIVTQHNRTINSTDVSIRLAAVHRSAPKVSINSSFTVYNVSIHGPAAEDGVLRPGRAGGAGGEGGGVWSWRGYKEYTCS